MSDETICFVGGGTGGHILPAITLAKKWHQEHKGVVVFFTSFIALNKDLDKKILDAHPFITRYFRSNLIKPPAQKFWMYPKFLFQFLYSFIQAIYILLYYHPDRIVSTGGYISIPVCLAGKLLGVSRLDLYDVNAEPGKASIFLSKFVDNIFVTFESCTKFFNNAKLVQYPIRFTEKDKEYDKLLVLDKLGLDKSRKTIFLIGGSQGALFLNKVLKRWLEDNQSLHPKVQIIHQVGGFDKYDWEMFYRRLEIPHILFKYSDDIKFYYQVADVVISRAGAGTVSELSFFDKHCLIIPHKTSYTSHQYQNAQSIIQDHPEKIILFDQDQIEQKFDTFNSQLCNFIVQNSCL